MSVETDSQSASTTDSSTDGSSVTPPASTDHSDAGLHSSLNSKVEAAFDRATSSKQGTDSTTTEDVNTGNGQAAGESSDSTQSGSDRQQAEHNGGASDSDKAQGDSASQQPLTAPESWPEERKTAFNSLDQKGQETLLAFYNDMVKGLNKSQEKLASEREALKGNFGADADAIKELVETAKTFESDPVAVLTKLADQAGVDIFFSPQGDEQIPQFESTEEQTRWLLKEQDRRSNQVAADKAREQARERAKEEQRQQISEQFAQAHKAHPDLAEHRDAVVEKLTTYQIPVEAAYQLATYESVKQVAAQASGYKAELDKARAEIETLKKSATVPPRGGNGAQQQPVSQRGYGLSSLVEGAMERAERQRATN